MFIEDHSTHPMSPIAGGEILVKTVETSWKGGRNLEFALSAAPMIERSEKIIITSADSDGTDSPTDITGGIVEGNTIYFNSGQGSFSLFYGYIWFSSSELGLKSCHIRFFTAYMTMCF